MKKILVLLLTILTLVSCVDTYRSDDIFIIFSKETSCTSYKYLYRTKLYRPTTRGLFYLGTYSFVSNENYELRDTIKFTRCVSNKK